MSVYAHHQYVDLSKRRPYICGVCRRDILDPIHHPELPGTRFAVPAREDEAEIEQEFEDCWPDNRQASLF